MSDTPLTDAITDAIARGEVNDYTALRDHAQRMEREREALRTELRDLVYQMQSGDVGIYLGDAIVLLAATDSPPSQVHAPDA